MQVAVVVKVRQKLLTRRGKLSLTKRAFKDLVHNDSTFNEDTPDGLIIFMYYI